MLYTPQFRAALNALPRLHETEGQGLDAIAQIRLDAFDICWTWYLVEFDGNDTLYGLSCGLEAEIGYVSLHELVEFRDTMSLPVEQDMHFKPTPIRAILQRYQFDNSYL